jgi:beta-hydroxylase
MWRNPGSAIALEAESPRLPIRAFVDRLIAASSMIPNDPVLDMRNFAWTAMLRANWQTIRDEAAAALADRTHRLPLWHHGGSEELAHRPRTAEALSQIPGLVSARYSTLASGIHVPPRRGATKGLVTCHLALSVPRDGDVRMALADRVLRWSEGETLVFDDSYEHELWNEASAPRTVLHLQFRRPLKQPARWLAERLL